MKRTLFLTPALALALALGACHSGGVGAEVSVALATKDAAKAEGLLELRLQRFPDDLDSHMQQFVVCDYLVHQGDPAQSDAYQRKAVAEYDWLAKKFGLTADYTNMGGSLKSGPGTGSALTAARKPLYGD